VRINVLATLATTLSPTGTFEHFDEHFAVHGGYCTYRKKGCKLSQQISHTTVQW
jgi:hypothetical protein